MACALYWRGLLLLVFKNWCDCQQAELQGFRVEERWQHPQLPALSYRASCSAHSLTLANIRISARI